MKKPFAPAAAAGQLTPATTAALHLPGYQRKQPPPLMKNLALADQRLLDAAEGWLGLGDPGSALEELEHISARARAHPHVLMVRWQIQANASQWAACVETAAAVVASAPHLPEGWVERSFALHELKRTQEAHDLLLPAERMFPKNWTIPYNLACYCSQLHCLEAAAQWLMKALALDEKTVRHEAADDPDLQPLWDSPFGNFWKRK